MAKLTYKKSEVTDINLSLSLKELEYLGRLLGNHIYGSGKAYASLEKLFYTIDKAEIVDTGRSLFITDDACLHIIND